MADGIDGPKAEDAYVLRIEDAAGSRLLIRVRATELEQADTFPCLMLKAETLVMQFLFRAGKLTDEQVRAIGWDVVELDGAQCLYKVIQTRATDG